MASNVQDLLSQARDSLTVKRVFGDPYEAGGVTFIPVVRVGGGGGGGRGQGPDQRGRGSGWGGVFGAEAVGAYVIKDGQVIWKPAVDVTRIVLRGQMLAVVGMLVARSIVRRLARRRR